MSFSISKLSDEQKLDLLHKLYESLPPNLREVHKLHLDQQAECLQEKTYDNPYVNPCIIKPPKKPCAYSYLSASEKIAYICHLAGIGSTKMSAFSKYSDRHIRRILAMACGKVAARKRG